MITAADIRAARARLHETQYEFASRFQVSRQTLAAWENRAPSEGPAQLLLERVLAELSSEGESNAGAAMDPDRA